MSWMIDEIDARGGAVSFRDFMEIALYHPRHGYYAADRSRYGRDGDFLTAPTASIWYGRVVAQWLDRLQQTCGPVTFADLASGDGSLIETVVRETTMLKSADLVEIISVESSEAMRSVQQRRFSGLHQEVTIRSSIDDVGHVGGPVIVHASELYDALPVHRVVKRHGELREFTVRTHAGVLGWGEVDASDQLCRYFEGHGVVFDEGQVAEANMDAEALHGTILDSCGDSGLVMVLDYGYPAIRLYDPRGRRGGSLVGYRGHRLEPDLLLDPGKQDLTAHVNWDDLRRSAEHRSWEDVGLYPLAGFLVRAGLADAMERADLGMEAELDANTIIERQEIKRLLNPEGMGSDLKMQIHGRGRLAEAARENLESPI